MLPNIWHLGEGDYWTLKIGLLFIRRVLVNKSAYPLLGGIVDVVERT